MNVSRIITGPTCRPVINPSFHRNRHHRCHATPIRIRWKGTRISDSDHRNRTRTTRVRSLHCTVLICYSLFLSPLDYTAQRLPHSGSFKQSLPAESSPSIILSSDSNYKAIRPNHSSNYRINEKVIVIENAHEKSEQDPSTFEGKPLKIIRVERTKPAIGNDTMKLTHRTVNE